jgi:membrane protein CcdC involved in cytochrome C biogenesis
VSVYSLVLFTHISGAIGFFIGLGLSVAVLAALRRAKRVEEIRTLTALIERSRTVTVISILVLLAAGVYMTVTTWGLTDWIAVALGSLVLIAPVNPVLVEPRIRTIAAMAREAPDGPLPDTILARIQSPALGMALYTPVPLLFGIVFLMAVKPTTAISLVVMGSALALGLVFSLMLWLNARVRGRARKRPNMIEGSRE